MQIDLAAIVIPGGLFVIALIGLFLSSSARFMTLREFEVYKQLMLREMDQIHDRLDVLEQTRPTTGELEARIERPRGGA